ncbi:hypothetical protein C8J57DRAFT_1616110 [Mycena rebaudengoi]|nr:hypothetical protein C8J57DRAFT_1616110 [Mycena rebaudengoi]
MGLPDFFGTKTEAAVFTQKISRILQQQLEDKQDERQILISSARSLPDDILREIFLAALPPDKNCAISSNEPPFLLCAICRSWRALVLSTPRLWTSLHIVAPPSAKLEKKLAGVVDTWLSQSGVLPLSVSLVPSRITERESVDPESMLLMTLLCYHTRWKCVRLVLLPNESFQHISALAVLGMSSRAGKHVSSKSSQCIYQHPEILLRWALLRHLALNGDMSLENVLDVLRQCVRLETCNLTVWATRDVPGMPCHMKYIRELRVTANGHMDGLSKFFEKMVLPSLRSLEYKSDSVAFLPLLCSANVVERLTLQESLLTTNLVEVLRLMPMLQELRLAEEPVEVSPSGHWPFPDGQLLPLLSAVADAGDPVLCPWLRRIHLKNFEQLSDKALLEFILARTGTHLSGDTAHLASVRVEFHRAMEFDIIPHFDKSSQRASTCPWITQLSRNPIRPSMASIHLLKTTGLISHLR